MAQIFVGIFFNFKVVAARCAADFNTDAVVVASADEAEGWRLFFWKTDDFVVAVVVEVAGLLADLMLDVRYCFLLCRVGIRHARLNLLRERGATMSLDRSAVGAASFDVARTSGKAGCSRVFWTALTLSRIRCAIVFSIICDRF